MQKQLDKCEQFDSVWFSTELRKKQITCHFEAFSPDLPYSAIVPWWANKMNSEHYWLLVYFFQYQFPSIPNHSFSRFLIAFHDLSRFAEVGWRWERSSQSVGASSQLSSVAPPSHRRKDVGPHVCFSVFSAGESQVIVIHGSYTLFWICRSWHVTVIHSPLIRNSLIVRPLQRHCQSLHDLSMWLLWQGLNETIRRVLRDFLVMGAAQPCCCEETQPKAQDELDARAFRFHSSGCLFPQGESTVDLHRFNCLTFEIFIEFQWSWNISPGSYCLRFRCWSLSKEQKSSWCCKKRIVNGSMIIKVWMFSLFLSPLSAIYGSSARQHCFKPLHQKSDKAVKNQSSPAWFLCPVRFDAFSSFDGEHLETDQMDETREMDQMGEMDGSDGFDGFDGFDLAKVFQKSDESSRGFEANRTSPKSTVKSSQSLRLEPESWQKRCKRAERRGTCTLVLLKWIQSKNVLFGHAVLLLFFIIWILWVYGLLMRVFDAMMWMWLMCDK